MSNVTVLGTFLEGLLSFLSPCVLPMVPLYMAYLSGDSKQVDENGNIKYNQKEVFIKTVFFVLGVFIVFSLLAISIQEIKQYVIEYKDIIAILGSVVIFAFGLHELGVIEISFLNKEISLKDKLKSGKMSYLKAFLFGFFFAFSWTPCIGPMLSSALLLAVSQDGGVVYLIAYALGLTIPFLVTGIATSTILNILSKYKKFVGVIMKISGVILICFSIYMFSSSAQNIKNDKKVITQEPVQDTAQEQAIEEKNAQEENNKTTNSTENIIYMPDIDFYDHNGNTINFKDYKDKYVVVSYSATWCQYCTQEIPAYYSFSKNHPEVVCLYAMSPEANGEDESSIGQYAVNNGVELPIIVDSDNILASYFQVSSFPTTCVIGPDNSMIGMVAGALDESLFEEVLNRTISMYESR